MKTVAIIGIGLIGGSLGQALRRTKRYRVIGVARRRETLLLAKRLSAIDQGSRELADVFPADIVVIASPVDQIIPIFKRLVPFLKPGTIVMDVGSVKSPIMKAAARVKRPDDIYFVGAHPLAGSHKTGVKASDFRLFEGSTVVLVPGPRAAVAALKSLWNAVGAQIQIMSAADHDRAVALTSHLPHALAHALVHTVLSDKRRRQLMPLLAGSFRDMTRVASSDPEQWAQILRANAPSIRRATDALRRELTRLEKLLERPRLRPHLKKSHVVRQALFNGI